MTNLNLLASFFVCAEHLNISKAAKILGISQPSLSMQIKNLEDQLGTPLFLRNGKSISLTSRGKDLLEVSSSFYGLQSEIERCLQVDEELTDKDFLRILVSQEVERPFVAEIVSKLAKRDRKKMAIIAASDNDPVRNVKMSDFDFILSHEEIKSDWNFIRITFPVFFATSSRSAEAPSFDDPNNIQKVIDYFGEDLIIPSRDTKLGREYENFRRKHGLKNKVLLESNIVSCLVRFVASGAGCGFLPLPYIKSSLYHNHINLIGPRQGYWGHSIYIYANTPKKQLEAHPLIKTIRNYGI